MNSAYPGRDVRRERTVRGGPALRGPARSGLARVARAVACGVLLAAGLAGCALFAPKLEKPELSIVGVQVVDAQFMAQRFNVKVRVRNPNDRELPITGIEYTMQVAGEDFGRGMSAKSFVVPALGEAEFDMIVTTNLAGSLLKLLPRLQGAGREAIDYRIEGTVRTDLMFLRRIPFTQKGTFALP